MERYPRTRGPWRWLVPVLIVGLVVLGVVVLLLALRPADTSVGGGPGHSSSQSASAAAAAARKSNKGDHASPTVKGGSRAPLSTKVIAASDPSGSLANPIDGGTWNVVIPGYGPAGHNYLYRVTENDANNNRRGRKYLTIEMQPYLATRCGKIDDAPVPHATNLNRFTGSTNCKFDESCGFDKNASLLPGFCSAGANNYYSDVARSIKAVDDTQWVWGKAALRFIKNGDNEPSRCLINKLNQTSYGTRFQPTSFCDRGRCEDNVYFDNAVQDEFIYDFPNPAWQKPQLDDLLCNVYCVVGDTASEYCKFSNGTYYPCTCGDCGTTIDDYILRYAISHSLDNNSTEDQNGGITDIHPFTGENCTTLGRCPLQHCHEYSTLHEFYAGVLGYYDNITGVIRPNTEAADHICTFNVGYLGDCFGGHEPCAYNEWNSIEYTTAGEFFYKPDGMSGICRGMQSESQKRVVALGGTLRQLYNEQLVRVDFVGSTSLAVITRSLSTGQHTKFTVPLSTGELAFGMTPGQMNNLTGTYIDYIKSVRAPNITHPIAGTPRGGAKYMEQPKSASPVTVNPQLTHPAFAFLFEDVDGGHPHMSARPVGRTGYHSRSEFYNDPFHRRTNIVRAVYSDYWAINEWTSLIKCMEQGNCNMNDVKRKLLFNWRQQFPNETSVQLLTEDDILDVYMKQTIDGWHWQTPGNHNSPEQLFTFAANPLANHPDVAKRGFKTCMISSGFDLQRDGWVSSAFRMVARCMQNNPRYNNPMGDGSMTVKEFWDQELYCGLRPNDINDPEDTDTSLALSTEHPHIYDPTSPTGYRFPDGDHTSGPTISVIASKVGNGLKWEPCAWDPSIRACTKQAYNSLPNVPCSAATPDSPY